MPNHVPVRPKPLTTSSAMSSTSYLSQIFRTMGQYSSPGTATPADAETGSPITAATVSGPSRRMISSIELAQWTAHSECVVAPDSHRYGSGWGAKRKMGAMIGSKRSRLIHGALLTPRALMLTLG